MGINVAEKRYDLLKHYFEREKDIVKLLNGKVDTYNKSKCKKDLFAYIDRLQSSWDMEIPGDSGAQFMGQLSYALVKQVMLSKRALFSANYRQDPLYTLTGIGYTPDENASNIQDLMERNNQLVKFRPSFLSPNINNVIQRGVGIAYTEYDNTPEYGWRTIADEAQISKRVYGITKYDDVMRTYDIDVRNYGRNPKIVGDEGNDINYHHERWTLSKLIGKYKANPGKYIKENVEKVIKRIKQDKFLKNEAYVDEDGMISLNDYGDVYLADVEIGQSQIAIEGNAEDPTFYNYEKVGDTIISFQDNPYDLNMIQHTVMTCERRREYFWGDTPAAYSIQNENSLNLLLGMQLENAIASMDRYVFYNSNSIKPEDYQNAPFGAKIPVDVSKDVNLSNQLWQYQPQDTSGSEVNQAMANILENDQRTQTEVDLTRQPSKGGMANTTAFAADIADQKGATEDADTLEQYSYGLSKVGEKIVIGIGQFVGNFKPTVVRPGDVSTIREIHKEHMMGNFAVKVDTALQRSYNGDIQKAMNLATWMQNLINGGAQIQPNFEPIAKAIIKMNKSFEVDKILPEQPAQQQLPPGAQPQLPQGMPQL